jgi:hypothetical protein
VVASAAFSARSLTSVFVAVMNSFPYFCWFFSLASCIPCSGQVPIIRIDFCCIPSHSTTDTVFV